MSNLGVAYKRAIDLTELSANPADGDFYVIVDVNDANREKKVLASRIQHIDSSTGNQTVDGALAVSGALTVDGATTLSSLNLVSYESNTIYFEGNAVFLI